MPNDQVNVTELEPWGVHDGSPALAQAFARDLEVLGDELRNRRGGDRAACLDVSSSSVRSDCVAVGVSDQKISKICARGRGLFRA